MFSTLSQISALPLFILLGQGFILAIEPLDTQFVDLLGQGVISAVVLFIWYKQFKQASKQQSESVKVFENIAEENKKTIATLLSYIDKDTKYKELLTGVLTRLEMQVEHTSKKVDMKG